MFIWLDTVYIKRWYEKDGDCGGSPEGEKKQEVVSTEKWKDYPAVYKYQSSKKRGRDFFSLSHTIDKWKLKSIQIS